MELTFKQLEAVFAERFGIAEDRAVAFRGRLQHLQRLNFPDGVNTGRGKKASYGWRQVIQMMVVLDLIDLGLTPDVAISRVRQSTDQMISAIYRMTLRFESPAKFVKAIQNGRCPFGKTVIVVTSAAALSFSHGTERDEAYLIAVDGPTFHRRLTEEDPAVEPAAAYIDLGSRMMMIANLVGRITAPGPRETATDLKEWVARWFHEDTAS